MINVYSYDSNSGGEREIQRTMLELLNQLDGFDSRGDVKVPMECTHNVKKKYEKSNYLIILRLSWQQIVLTFSIQRCCDPVVLTEKLNSLHHPRLYVINSNHNGLKSI